MVLATVFLAFLIGLEYATEITNDGTSSKAYDEDKAGIDYDRSVVILVHHRPALYSSALACPSAISSRAVAPFNAAQRRIKLWCVLGSMSVIN